MQVREMIHFYFTPTVALIITFLENKMKSNRPITIAATLHLSSFNVVSSINTKQSRRLSTVVTYCGQKKGNIFLSAQCTCGSIAPPSEWPGNIHAIHCNVYFRSAVRMVDTCYTSCGCNRNPFSADWGHGDLICYGANRAVNLYKPKVRLSWNESAGITGSKSVKSV